MRIGLTGGGMTADRQRIDIPIREGIELRLEQVNGSRQCQDHHEGNAEEAGVEVPAPEGPVSKSHGAG